MTFIAQSGSAGDTSLSSMPSHIAGDYLVMCAYNPDSNTVPGLGSGWTSIIQQGANGNAIRLAFKKAASSSESSGTWSNAYNLRCHSYRDVSGIGASAVGGGTNTTLQFPALTLQSPGLSEVVRFGCNIGNNNLSTGASLSGYVNRTGSGWYVVGFDSNGPVASNPAAANLTGQNPQYGWSSVSVELLGILPSATGKFFQFF